MSLKEVRDAAAAVLLFSSGFLPPTMSYVTYDVVRHARTTSYVRRTTSC